MSSEPPGAALVTTREVRLLEGPNLYFPRPAVKVTLALPGYLEAEPDQVRTVCAALGVPSRSAGAPGSEQRQRLLLRVVEKAARALAREAGTRRLGIRTRPASETSVVLCAFVWRHRGRAEALGAGLGPVLADLLAGCSVEDAVRERARKVAGAPAGEPPRVVTPGIPVASVTGTNGKTTTTRLIAHICMTAGLRTGWSSTDGVLVQGELVEDGDYSGPAGARAVLAAPGVQVGILETARGGMLLRGMGVAHNDVSVVTNVSADHLGMQGIDTVDQLAEVKAIVTRVTRPQGGWSSTGRTRGSGRCAPGPGRGPGCSPPTRTPRLCGRRLALAAGPPPFSTTTSRSSRRIAAPTVSCASSTCRWRWQGSPTTTSSTRWPAHQPPSGWGSNGPRSSRAFARSARTTSSTPVG